MVQSLERAFKLIEILDAADSETGAGVQALSNEVGLKLPTVHNLLKTLIRLGYVKQNSEGKYILGPKSYSLGTSGKNRKSFSDIAYPLARTLNREVNETVVVAFYTNRTWYSLFHLNSNQELNVRSSLPMTKNLYISATGRAILSNLTDNELDSYVRENGLPNNDWDNISDIENLKSELADIRKKGYAVYHKNDVISLGRPIHSDKKKLDAAIGIYLPESRYKGAHQKAFLNGLQKTSEAILTIFEN